MTEKFVMSENRIPESMLNTLFNGMIDYYSGDAKRIQHFVKVHSFAKLIGEMEKLDKETLLILETAAYVHDIGIKNAEKKYGNCGGKLQEQEGPAEAKKLLERLGFDRRITERVCYLVSKHHTYTDINGMDYQILVEADFLVNMYEDNVSKSGIQSAYKNIFKTRSGKQLCNVIFDVVEA